MSLTENGGLSAADVAAVTGNNGFGGFGGDGAWWLLVLFLFAFNGNGWGNNGGFGGGNYGAGSLYPWMNQAEITSDGFRDQMINNNITSIRDSIGNLSTQLCNTSSDIQMALCNGFAGVEQGANARQMANMQTAFAGQTAMAQGFNGVQSQLAQCCCDNRLATADLKYTIATENCADRYEASQNTRDIIDSQTRGTQTIIDKLCQLELDSKNTKIADLERQLTMANLAASQTAQNAFIQQGLTNEVDQLYNRLSNCPVPTVPVYGRQPIFQCNNNSGCGCGCNGGF